MGHNVGKAAEMAVNRSERRSKGVVELTQEERLKNIRNLLASKLAVTPDDQRLLLALYDGAVAQVAIVREGNDKLAQQLQDMLNENVRLTEANEQFRTVYEQENRSMAVKVERNLPDAVFEPATPMAVGTPVGLPDGSVQTVTEQS